MNNKEKIFSVSIDLFSRYGYDGVSIRQIAREVGIKESSIYNHYKSKESILNTILEFYIEEMKSDKISLTQANENLNVSLEYFYNAGLDLYILKLSKPNMMNITRIILVEAYHNEKIRQFIKKEMVDGPINGWILLFNLMKDNNLIDGNADSRQLAESFYYYGLYLLNEHFIINYPEDDEKFLRDLAVKSQRHMKLIYDSVKLG